MAKIAAQGLRQDVDRLIDWYERFKPDVKQVAVSCTPKELYDALAPKGQAHEYGTEIQYRGFKVWIFGS